MGKRSELESLFMKRNYFFEIGLLTFLLKLSPQCICKIIERVRSIGMGWREELESLSVERNSFIEIKFLTFQLKSEQQYTTKIAHRFPASFGKFCNSFAEK